MEYAKQRGAATIKVQLDNSVITVRHGDTNEILLERIAYDGDWKWIWEALSGDHIPSADPYRAAYYAEDTLS